MPTQQDRTTPGTTKPSYVRRLGLERATKSGFSIFIKGKIEPRVALGLPPGTPRKFVKQLAEKACRERVNKENASGERKSRQASRKDRKQALEFQALVNTMTNRQRTLWARAGYPGLRQKDIKALKRFTNLGFAELLARRPTL